MAKPKNMEAWGRDTARQRYGRFAGGGEVESPAEDAAPNEEPESPLAAQPADRAAEVDEFISRVMRDQIKKMENE